MINRVILSLFCIAALGLSGCSSTKKTLGLEKKAPDEFSVVKRAPLALPPSYNLRPPSPGAPRPQEQAPSDQAQQSVFGSSEETGAVKNNAVSGAAENALLLRAGALNADPDIRQKVDKEVGEIDEKNKPVAEKLLGIVREQEPTASVVDAQKEAERIQKNIEEGKDVTEGETPSVEK